MFAALRERLVGAWVKLRQGSLAKLFVFEFVVVLLGVLAAQWVADWAGTVQLNRQAQAAYEDARNSAQWNNNNAYRWWSLKAPCVIERAQEVARAAANGETMTRREIGRPALPRTFLPLWNENVRQAAMVLYGRERMNALADFEETAIAMNEANMQIRNAWSTFALLDPANGEPSEADRHAVRLAAVQAADYLRWLRFLYDSRAENREILGLEEAEFGQISTATDECGMLKDWG